MFWSNLFYYPIKPQLTGTKLKVLTDWIPSKSYNRKIRIQKKELQKGNYAIILIINSSKFS
jgi:hypothetical protein